MLGETSSCSEIRVPFFKALASSSAKVQRTEPIVIAVQERLAQYISQAMELTVPRYFKWIELFTALPCLDLLCPFGYSLLILIFGELLKLCNLLAALLYRILDLVKQRFC